MLKSSEIRAKARAFLGGDILARPWLMALVACLPVTILSVSPILGAIPILGAFADLAATFFVAVPLSMGVKSYFIKLIRKEDPDFGEIFSGFNEEYISKVLLGFMLFLTIGLWSLLFVIPGILKAYSYALVYYIKNDHPEYSWRECFIASNALMKGNRWKLFCLQFSFIGWTILGMLCLGLGGLWITPYRQTATAIFYEELKNS